METKPQKTEVTAKVFALTDCLSCGKRVQLNATQTCEACSKKDCKDCGKKFRVSLTQSLRCGLCARKRQRMLQRRGDF